MSGSADEAGTQLPDSENRLTVWLKRSVRLNVNGEPLSVERTRCVARQGYAKLLLASTAVLTLCTVSLHPVTKWLSAASEQDNMSGPGLWARETAENVEAADDLDVMEISPRASGSRAGSVPPQSTSPPQSRSSGNHSAQDTLREGTRQKSATDVSSVITIPSSAASSDDGTAQSRRAVLQRPVFLNTTSPENETLRPASAGSAAKVSETAAQNGPGRTGSGFNYVDAAGLASLPYAGTTTGRAQDGIPPLRPTSPVPPVPVPGPVAGGSLPSSQGGVEGGADQNAALRQRETEGARDIGNPENSATDADGTHRGMTGSGSSESQKRSAIAPVPKHTSRAAGPAPGTSGFRATVESDAPHWIGPYMGRTSQLPPGIEFTPTPPPSVQIPSEFSAWWDEYVRHQAGIAPRTLAVDVTSLVQQALVYAPQVQVLQSEPEIQQRVVRQEEAAFDWRTFLEARYDDFNDPIGNTLTTGNNDDRFKDQNVSSSGGLRRRTTTGADVKLSQQFGYQQNNSLFLLPNPQSTSRLELSFRQPLMSRSGTVYNESQIVLARISASSASDETLDSLQRHLFSVAEAYWKLYQARAEFFQRQKLLASARSVLATLEGRHQVDTIPRQILRARAAVARAESRMQRAVTDIRNAESQLRLLVNDPEMLNGGPVEFTPTESPAMVATPVGLRESLQSALVNRPDISRAIRQMRGAGVRLGVSRNEMLPKLDFIVSSYVAGLEDRSQFAQSFGNQFSDGRPGFSVGLEFEVPLGNRAARARNEQRHWELKRAINTFRATVETSLTEVEISSREVDTAWRDLLGRYQAMVAAQNEVSYLQDRFEVLPFVEDSSILLLEDLLDGFERLADEETSFAQAQVNYALSIIQLRRATGTLMRTRFDSPELAPDESEWMTTRAEQTAIDAADRSVVRNHTGRSAGIEGTASHSTSSASGVAAGVRTGVSGVVGNRTASGPAAHSFVSGSAGTAASQIAPVPRARHASSDNNTRVTDSPSAAAEASGKPPVLSPGTISEDRTADQRRSPPEAATPRRLGGHAFGSGF